MRIEALTFLRFVAAFVVVMGHFGTKTTLVQVVGPFAVAGPPMVTFFFVLSGFVMVLSQWSKPDASTASYYRARLARIGPIYWVAMLIMVAFGTATGPQPAMGVLLNATFLQAWVPPWPLSVNGPAWSVSVEAFFYLLFPLLLSTLRRGRFTPRQWIALALGLWAATQIALTIGLNSGFYGGYPSASHDLIFYSPPAHLCSFVLGAAGGYWLLEGGGRRGVPGVGGLTLGLASFALVFAAIQHGAALDAWVGLRLPAGSSLLAPLFLALILSLARADNGLTRALSARPLRWLGDVSYAVYILQWPMAKLYQGAVLGGRAITTDGEFWAYAALLVAAAWLSSFLVEKPGRRLILGRGARKAR